MQPHSRPLVSVLIVNFNSGDMLRRALDALACQEFRDFEIIVVDNASEDRSAEKAVRPDLPVRLITANRNLGFAEGSNLAAEYARATEWLVLLNPDAFPEPGWLGALVDAAREHPKFAMFGSRLIVEGDRRLLDGIGDAYHVSGLHWREGYMRPAGPDSDQPREIFAPCGAAAMYRRNAFEVVGGFDEDFFCYAEDVDLGFRMRLAGNRAMYVPDAVVYHVGSASTSPGSDFCVYHGHRNLIWIYVKNMPSSLFWRYLPYHLFVNLASVAILARRGQGAVALRAKVDALNGLSSMLAKRRTIQSGRKAETETLLAVMSRGWPDRRRRSSTSSLSALFVDGESCASAHEDPHSNAAGPLAASVPHTELALLTRNTLWNLLGQGIPLLVAVMTIPAVIRGWGSSDSVCSLSLGAARLFHPLRSGAWKGSDLARGSPGRDERFRQSGGPVRDGPCGLRSPRPRGGGASAGRRKGLLLIHKPRGR